MACLNSLKASILPAPQHVPGGLEGPRLLHGYTCAYRYILPKPHPSSCFFLAQQKVQVFVQMCITKLKRSL